MKHGILGVAALLQSKAARFWVVLLCFWLAVAPALHLSDGDCCFGESRIVASHDAAHELSVASELLVNQLQGAAGSRAPSDGLPSDEANVLSASKPLICYCPPRQRSQKYRAHFLMAWSPKLALHVTDGTCLACLLQSLPGQTVALPQLLPIAELTSAPRWTNHTPQLHSTTRIIRRGRAPPLTI